MHHGSRSRFFRGFAPASRFYSLHEPGHDRSEGRRYSPDGKDWREAVHQLHRYQRQAPLMLTPNVFCVAADEDEFRYGTVLFHDASKDDIERHLDLWTRWLSL